MESKKNKKESKEKEKKENKEKEVECEDKLCPFHGKLSIRGRRFRGFVIRKFPRRVCIEFERTLYVKKYERYATRKTRIHARLPDCLFKEIQIGDYIEVAECRPLSKMISFVAVKKIKGKEEK